MESQEKCLLQRSSSEIFNHSWMKGVVPAVWKEAIVIPVPKKGKDKKNPRSYRPISTKLRRQIAGEDG